MYLAGQICGLIGTVITVFQPQCRKKVGILLCCIAANGMNALNFALIGETGSSVYLCLVAIAQALVSIFHEKKHSDITKGEAILFLLLYLGFGFYGMINSPGFVWGINGHLLLELLPIIGALMLMLSVFAKTEQRTRMFLLLNSAAWLVYTAIVGAAVFFSSVLSIISSAIALWKYRKK